jgi:hypothetical protein
MSTRPSLDGSPAGQPGEPSPQVSDGPVRQVPSATPRAVSTCSAANRPKGAAWRSPAQSRLQQTRAGCSRDANPPWRGLPLRGVVSDTIPQTCPGPMSDARQVWRNLVNKRLHAIDIVFCCSELLFSTRRVHAVSSHPSSTMRQATDDGRMGGAQCLAGRIRREPGSSRLERVPIDHPERSGRRDGSVRPRWRCGSQCRAVECPG